MEKEHGNFAVLKTSLLICSLSEGFGSNSLNPVGQLLSFIIVTLTNISSVPAVRSVVECPSWTIL